MLPNPVGVDLHDAHVEGAPGAHGPTRVAQGIFLERGRTSRPEILSIQGGSRFPAALWPGPAPWGPDNGRRARQTAVPAPAGGPEGLQHEQERTEEKQEAREDMQLAPKKNLAIYSFHTANSPGE